jgi:hypothetical protein
VVAAAAAVVVAAVAVVNMQQLQGVFHESYIF